MIFARSVFGLLLGFAGMAAASAAEPVHVYDPGGPYPALKEAAEVFGKAHGIDVQVTAGPTGKWLEQAKGNADVIFSGSEDMMSDFVTAFGGQIDAKTVTPLYLRPSAILVRPGNPGHIKGIADLLKPGHKILVVNGSGQGGLWEDVAGRMGDIASVKTLRANIGQFAATSADAKQTWTTDSSYDAWLIWNIWQVANPTIADQVAVEPEYRVYRDAGVALTQRGDAKPEAKAFAAFLASPEGAKIFAKWGWIVPGAAK
jgi:accessory colonization factor AcfC